MRYQIGSIKDRHPFVKNQFIPAPSERIESLVESLIQECISKTDADDYLCVLSGTGNFRNDIATIQKYKGNRNPNVTRPYHYDTVGDYIIKNHPHVIVDGCEADDFIGIEQRKEPFTTVTASRDKDLDTFEGWHFRWACGDKQPERPMHWISRFKTYEFFFYQMLVGDSTDNIMGCGEKREMMWGGNLVMRRKGIGKETAKELLSKCYTCAQFYITVYKEYYKLFGDRCQEVMLENARLLYIGQTPDNLFDWDWIDYSTWNINEEDHYK